ncbi:MAG: DUF2975 domain-containing protein [Pseudomonadota bacterium]
MAFARLMMWVTRFLALSLPIMVLGIWLLWDRIAPTAAQMSGLALDPASIGWSARIGAAGLMMLGAGLQAFGLWCLSHTFQEAASERALSETAIAGFQRFSWIVLVMVPVGIAIRAGVIAIVSAADSVPGGFLPITFGTGELQALFIGALLVFVAQVFRQGQAAQQENQAFI